MFRTSKLQWLINWPHNSCLQGLVKEFSFLVAINVSCTDLMQYFPPYVIREELSLRLLELCMPMEVCFTGIHLLEFASALKANGRK